MQATSYVGLIQIGQYSLQILPKVDTRQQDDVPRAIENLLVIGTMNTADRSIALLDTALRRRFVFKEMPPQPELLTEVIAGEALASLLTHLNQRIERHLDRDHCVGHSYLMGLKTLADLEFVWYHKIIPLLQEYFYNDGERLQAVLGDFISHHPATDGVFERDIYRIKVLSGEEFVAALQGI